MNLVSLLVAYLLKKSFVIFACFAFPNKSFFFFLINLLLGLENKAKQNLNFFWNIDWNCVTSMH